jgi:hypothetical protein
MEDLAMAASTRWKLLAAVGALTLAMNACGDDDKPAPNGDGDSGDGDGDGDGGDGDAPKEPTLKAGAAGLPCTKENEDDVCGEKGVCKNVLSGGELFSTLGGVLGLDVDFGIETSGGYCSGPCSNKDTDPCNTGGVCFGGMPTGLPIELPLNLSGECRQGCETDADCTREGYECAFLNPEAVDALSGAGGGGSGNPLAGLDFNSYADQVLPKSCQPKATAKPIDAETVGKACSEDADCGAGYCLGAEAASDAGPAVQGSCSSVCTKNEDCGSPKGICTGIIYGSAGTCVETCTQDNECKRYDEGFNCQAVGNINTCVPPTGTNPQPDAGTDDEDAGVEPDASTGDAG